MKSQSLTLYSLAQEWASLRERVQTEKDPVKVVAIVQRLRALLSEAEELVGLNDEDSGQNAFSDAMQSDRPSQESGE
jgi:hypothetical protein